MTDPAIAAFLSEKIYDDLTDKQTFGLPSGSSNRFEVKTILNDTASGAYGAIRFSTKITWFLCLVGGGNGEVTQYRLGTK